MLLHSESAVRRSRDRIGRSITILMVAMPLYCKSLGFQFETKLCIFQNISKYFFEKIPHVLPNVQYGDNQTDITKMLNIGDDPAEWDFGRVPPPTPHLRPHFRNLRLSGAGHANEAVRFSKHNRWRSKEMQSAGLCGPQPRRAEARNCIRIVAFPAGCCPYDSQESHCHDILCCSPTAACVVFIFGGCGGRALREPPKITPLRGAVVRYCKRASLTRGRSDFGKRAVAATERKESETF